MWDLFLKWSDRPVRTQSVDIVERVECGRVWKGLSIGVGEHRVCLHLACLHLCLVLQCHVFRGRERPSLVRSLAQCTLPLNTRLLQDIHGNRVRQGVWCTECWEPRSFIACISPMNLLSNCMGVDFSLGGHQNTLFKRSANLKELQRTTGREKCC